MSATQPLSVIPEIVQRAGTRIVRVHGGRRPRTGLIWSDGLVITRARGLDPGDEVRVRDDAGTDHTAEVVGRDGASDLALLRVEGVSGEGPARREDLPALGEPVVVVYRPGGVLRTALAIVGVRGDEFRTPAGAHVDAWLELDRELPRGVSGAPVLDLEGKVVGVLSRGVVRGATLLLPSTTVSAVVEQLQQAPTISRGYVGLAAHPARLSVALAESLGQDRAVVVAAVERDGPADKAGVLVGDVIVAIDEDPIHSPLQLRAAVQQRTGRAVATTILRGGQRTTVSIEPAPRA